MKENLKVKNLLKKVLENKEFEYSFNDRTEGIWDGNDYEIIYEKYTFKYRIIVEENILGTGSNAAAGITVIIDDILVDGESVYDGWAEIGFSENVWYIDKLHDHLNDEVFDVFPFSFYPTFYGHTEETHLNESVDESINGSEKIKNLLKKVLENREFVYSFNDTAWDDDRVTEKYTIEYHIEVEENILGSGSNTVAGISVIIDEILLNGEDFYYDWVDSGYSENAWYIDYLHHHLTNEVLDMIPFSIYPTFYGHDEER